MRSDPVFLVPVNFSDASYKAVEYGILLAREMQGRLRLLHVIDIEDIVESDNTAVVQRHMDTLLETATRSMKSFKEMIADAFFLDVDTQVVFGHVEYTILKEIKREVPEVVLLGKQSNQSRIVRSIVKSTSCPVLVVPRSDLREIKAPSKIVLATDMKPVKSYDLQFLIHLARKNNALSLLHVHDEGADDNDLAEYAKRFSSIVEVHTELIRAQSKEIVGGVLSSVGSASADLLCTVKRKRGYFSRFFEPTVSIQLAVESTIPTLVLSGT